jgi:sulfur relay (sulfurtransferase) complex TusBCD TusD component (DsrE family)
LTVAVMLASDAAADRAAVAGICQALRRQGHRALLFLVGDGVRAAEMGSELAAAGVDVSLCEADAALRGIYKAGQPGVFFGSLYDWARLAEDADRLLSFA